MINIELEIYCTYHTACWKSKRIDFTDATIRLSGVSDALDI